MKYKVVCGALWLPKKLKLAKGAIVPESVPAEIVESLLRQGKIAPAEAAASAAPKLPASRGKWCVDPLSLVGKGHEQLCALVHEIDKDLGVQDLKQLDVGELVRMLTQEWDEAFRASPPAPVKDSAQPLDHVVLGDKALREAREKAQGI